MKLIPYKEFKDMLSPEEIWECVQFDFPVEYKEKILNICEFYEESMVNFQCEKDVKKEEELEKNPSLHKEIESLLEK